MPGVLNRNPNCWPGASVVLDQIFVSLVVVWDALPILVQRTVEPALTVMTCGLKAKSMMVTS